MPDDLAAGQEPVDALAAAGPGDPDAALHAGDELLKGGDVDGAQAAFESAPGPEAMQATLNLAALLEDRRKDLAAAEVAWRRADSAGSLSGAGNLARLLREKGDLRGAAAAFRPCGS